MEGIPAAGFEPATSGLGNQCSIQLSYAGETNVRLYQIRPIESLESRAEFSICREKAARITSDRGLLPENHLNSNGQCAAIAHRLRGDVAHVEALAFVEDHAKP